MSFPDLEPESDDLADARFELVTAAITVQAAVMVSRVAPAPDQARAHETIEQAIHTLDVMSARYVVVLVRDGVITIEGLSADPTMN